MNKNFMQMFLLLTVLQITFYAQASAGKKQGPKKTLSKKELKAQAAFDNAEFESLIAQEEIQNDKYYKKMVAEKKQKSLSDSSETMRHFITSLNCKLREFYVDESDIEFIGDCYRAMIEVEADFVSRSLDQAFILNDQIFIDFFKACELAISGSIIEAKVIGHRDVLQVCMHKLLEFIRGKFYRFVLKFHQDSIDNIHAQLVKVIVMQEEVIAVFNANKVDDALLQSNLATFREFLAFIERR